MWGAVYLFVLVVAFGATYLGITPPRRRADIVQPVAAITATILFALAAIASLNVQVPDGAGGEHVYRSGYLFVLWAVFGLANIVGAFYAAFDEAAEQFEEPPADARREPYSRQR